MAVAFDAAGAGNSGKVGTGTLTVSWLHTNVGTDSLAAVVGVVIGKSGSPSATVTYGGVTMTSLGFVGASGPTGSVAMYGLMNPPTGTQTVSCSVATGGSSTGLVGESMTYTGVAGFGPAVTSTAGSGSTFSFSVTVPDDGMSAATYATTASSAASYNQTQRYSGTTTVTFDLWISVFGDSTSTGSVTYTATVAGSAKASVAVPLLPSMSFFGAF